MDNLWAIDLPPAPSLSQEEVRELLRRAQQEGQVEARDELITANLRLVVSIVQRFKGRAELEDLFQIGSLALVKAIENFDLSRNVKFSTYAVPVIIGEIRRYLRQNRPVKVSRSVQDLAYAATKKRDELLQELGRQPTPAELAEALDVDREELMAALDAIAPPASFSEVIHEEEGQPVYLGDNLGIEPEQENWLNKYALRELCDNLPEPDSEIVKLRFFKGLTQTEVARIIGVSQAQVSRLEKNALTQLKKLLA